MTQEAFLIEHLLPDDYVDHEHHTQRAIFFHPKCFISLAGEEWARRCGYKIEKPLPPLRSPPIPIEPNTTMPDGAYQFEYRDVKFKVGSNLRVYRQNVDGKMFYSVEELDKK